MSETILKTWKWRFWITRNNKTEECWSTMCINAKAEGIRREKWSGVQIDEIAKLKYGTLAQLSPCCCWRCISAEECDSWQFSREAISLKKNPNKTKQKNPQPKSKQPTKRIIGEDKKCAWLKYTGRVYMTGGWRGWE